MNIPEESIGNYPNVSVLAGSNPVEVMREHGVEPPFSPSEGPSSQNMDTDAGKAWNKAGKPVTGPLRLMRELRGYVTEARYGFGVDDGKFKVDENLPTLGKRIEEELKKAIEIHDEALGDAARFKHERDSLRSLYDESIEINEAIANERDRAFAGRDEIAKTLNRERKQHYEHERKLEAERDELEAFAKRLEKAAQSKADVTLFDVEYVCRDKLELTVYNEASDDELFRCSYCHCRVYNIDMTEGDCGWGFTFCPQCGGEVYESDSRKIEAKLDEPTNGIDGETNGIHDGITLPEGDAVKLMRECCIKDILDALGIDCHDKHHTRKMVQILADMVERDYVKRDVVDDDAYMRGLMAGRASLDDEFAELITERDEWKTKAEGYADALEKLGCSVLANGTVFEGSSNRAGSGKRAAAVERLRHFTSYEEGDGYYWDVTRALLGESPVEYTSEELLSALIDLLTDEPMDAGLDDDGTCPIDDGTSPNTEHVTNLEWLYEHDRDALIDGMTCTNQLCNECKFGLSDGYHYEYCAIDDREWLMAPHMDAQQDNDETSPIAGEDSREKLEGGL